MPWAAVAVVSAIMASARAAVECMGRSFMPAKIVPTRSHASLWEASAGSSGDLLSSKAGRRVVTCRHFTR